ncbi:alpha/beta hydrolase [Nocardia macrotermitis]|uniref:Serine aminopeptidase S33 domain-containing protein n=1 Tax=Nocardia macrotermitis TaxID=2585198 RepID=A0A7K0DAB8_9NOCA|nr:alpha/beta fold hydrolase [Nocardia macrotermitis]MQY22549.1 hypothetical protein [Nocardia macrotermitis]
MSEDFREVTFNSHGTDCDAWFFEPTVQTPFDRGAGSPVVVMAHGFGGTKDSGLAPFARGLRDSGLAVFAFDYRGFGSSGGARRQRVSMVEQAQDYRAAIAAAGRQPGVDPARVVVWGVSMSGGHALTVAADRSDVCAVIAMVPLVSGAAAGKLAYEQLGAGAIAGSTVTAVRSAVAARVGREPVMMPLVGRPGERAALTAEGYYENYLALAGPTWRNEVDAAVGLEIGNYRVGRQVTRIDAPVLVQIADFDRVAPPHAAAKVAFTARAEVRHYPCDHFDIFPGQAWFDAAVTHQIRFLSRHLADVAQKERTA